MPSNTPAKLPFVAEAGLAGAVTIATNMAGRGTDKWDPKGKKMQEVLPSLVPKGTKAAEWTGSCVVVQAVRATLGSSLFFVSLEDDLMRMFGSEKIAGMMDKLGYKEGDVIQHSMISNSIQRVQKKVEENNFGIRKRLLSMMMRDE